MSIVYTKENVRVYSKEVTIDFMQAKSYMEHEEKTS